MFPPAEEHLVSSERIGHELYTDNESGRLQISKHRRRWASWHSERFFLIARSLAKHAELSKEPQSSAMHLVGQVQEFMENLNCCNYALADEPWSSICWVDGGWAMQSLLVRTRHCLGKGIINAFEVVGRQCCVTMSCLEFCNPVVPQPRWRGLRLTNRGWRMTERGWRRSKSDEGWKIDTCSDISGRVSASHDWHSIHVSSRSLS